MRRASLVAGAGILLVGVGALALVRPWGLRLPRWLVIIPALTGSAYAAAHALTAYITKPLHAVGLVELRFDGWAQRHETQQFLWDLLFYEPWFLGLGVLVSLATLHHHRRAGGSVRAGRAAPRHRRRDPRADGVLLRGGDCPQHVTDARGCGGDHRRRHATRRPDRLGQHDGEPHRRAARGDRQVRDADGQARVRRLDHAAARRAGRTSCCATRSSRCSSSPTPRGKNSTDSALIIDAMDLLYAGNLEGFVIVSSDSDFTRLATRLRESGMTVYGLGRRNTPAAFVAACDRFIYLDLLSEAPQRASDDEEPAPPLPNLKRTLSTAISEHVQGRRLVEPRRGRVLPGQEPRRVRPSRLRPREARRPGPRGALRRGERRGRPGRRRASCGCGSRASAARTPGSGAPGPSRGRPGRYWHRPGGGPIPASARPLAPACREPTRCAARARRRPGAAAGEGSVGLHERRRGGRPLEAEHRDPRGDQRPWGERLCRDHRAERDRAAAAEGGRVRAGVLEPRSLGQREEVGEATPADDRRSTGPVASR